MTIQQMIFCVLFLLSIDVKAHGDIHQQIDKLTVKIEQTPSVDLLLKRALLFSDESDLVQAWKDIETARSISPKHPKTLYLGAQIALRSKQLNKALNLANQLVLIAKKPAEFVPTYALLSDIYQAKNQSDKALFYLKKSIRFHSKPLPSHWVKLAELQLKHEGYPAALSRLKQALSQSGTSLTLQQKIIEISEHNKDYTTALFYVDQQLIKATSLRELSLLVKKIKLLRLKGEPNQALFIKKKAQLAFQCLPTHKKNIAIAQSIQRELE